MSVETIGPRVGLELAVACDLAREAGARLRRFRASGPLAVREKAGGEPVTAADLAADAIIRRGLARHFPGDALYSEETPDSRARLGSQRVWIVDPLDSTSNFVSGGDEYSVSIGLAINRRPLLGVVYNPTRDELVAGCEGQGVTLNGTPTQASDATTLASARLSVSRTEWQRGLANWAGALRVTPCASMAYKLARVAAGLDDGDFSVKPRKEWGICAGVALVLAAGGRATLLNGTAVLFNRPQPTHWLGLLAAGPALYPLLLTWIAENGPENLMTPPKGPGHRSARG